MRTLSVILAEEIFAQVPLEIPPNCMNMVRVVLRVVVFEKKSWTLNTIIMRLPSIEATGPAEIHLIKTCLLDLLDIVRGDVGANSFHVAFDQLHKGGVLCLVEL